MWNFSWLSALALISTAVAADFSFGLGDVQVCRMRTNEDGKGWGRTWEDGRHREGGVAGEQGEGVGSGATAG